MESNNNEDTGKIFLRFELTQPDAWLEERVRQAAYLMDSPTADSEDIEQAPCIAFWRRRNPHVSWC